MTTVRNIAETFGLTMLDAAKPLEVTILPKDIKGSKANNQSECAIARAVCRQHGAKNAYILRTTAWVDDGEHLVRYSLPMSLQKEIVSFDRNRDFRPGDYHLSACNNRHTKGSLSLGKKKRAAAKPSAKRPKTTAPPHRSDGVRSTELDPRGRGGRS